MTYIYADKSKFTGLTEHRHPGLTEHRHPGLTEHRHPGLTEHRHPRLDRGSKQYNSEEGYGEERIYILHDKSE